MSKPSYTGATPWPDQWRRFASCEAVCCASSGLVAIALRRHGEAKGFADHAGDYRTDSVARYAAIARLLPRGSSCVFAAKSVAIAALAARRRDRGGPGARPGGARARDSRAGHHARHPQRHRPGNFTRGCNYTMRLTTQVNLPKMKAGGLDVSFMIVYVGQSNPPQVADAFQPSGLRSRLQGGDRQVRRRSIT